MFDSAASSTFAIAGAEVWKRRFRVACVSAEDIQQIDRVGYLGSGLACKIGVVMVLVLYEVGDRIRRDCEGS